MNKECMIENGMAERFWKPPVVPFFALPSNRLTRECEVDTI
jgi:hypothetical protein